MSNRRRKNELKVFLSDEEKTLLNEKVKMSRLSNTSAFIRQMIKYGFVYYVDYENLQEVLRQIRGIGVNVNQIAHKANATDSVEKSDVEKLRKEMKDLWRAVRSMLSEQPSVEQ